MNSQRFDRLRETGNGVARLQSITLEIVQMHETDSCICRMVRPRDSAQTDAYGVFYATHTGQGGPCPPTGKSVKTDYVYVMDFEGEKIRHMTKIWHAGLAMKALGWS